MLLGLACHVKHDLAHGLRLVVLLLRACRQQRLLLCYALLCCSLAAC